MWLNRYICDVIEECRVCVKTLNFGILPSLLHEIQVMASRMEAKLSDVKDLETLHESISDLREQKHTLEKEIKEFEKEFDKRKEIV